MARPCSLTPARWGWTARVEAQRLALPQRPIARLAQDEQPGVRSDKAKRRGRLGAMTHNEHLAQADRFIAECKNRIVRQREIIASVYENGQHRQLVLDQ